MKREYIVENNDLIKKEKKLKRKNFFSNLIIVILALVAIYLGIQGYTNERDSWFFQNYINTEATETTETSTTDLSDGTVSAQFSFINLVKGGYTKYVFKNAETDWVIFETNLLSNTEEALMVDISNHLGAGETKAIMITEYYGGFGNLVDSESKEIVIRVEK